MLGRFESQRKGGRRGGGRRGAGISRSNRSNNALSAASAASTIALSRTLLSTAPTLHGVNLREQGRDTNSLVGWAAREAAASRVCGRREALCRAVSLVGGADEETQHRNSLLTLAARLCISICLRARCPSSRHVLQTSVCFLCCPVLRRCKCGHGCSRHLLRCLRTKKAGVVGKYGTRYGASLRKVVKKMEVSQHAT